MTGGFIKYVAGINSGAMIYKPSFIKTGSMIKKLIGGDVQTHGDMEGGTYEVNRRDGLAYHDICIYQVL
jgi:hypothetical protein